MNKIMLYQGNCWQEDPLLKLFVELNPFFSFLVPHVFHETSFYTKKGKYSVATKRVNVILEDDWYSTFPGFIWVLEFIKFKIKLVSETSKKGHSAESRSYFIDELQNFVKGSAPFIKSKSGYITDTRYIELILSELHLMRLISSQTEDAREIWMKYIWRIETLCQIQYKDASEEEIPRLHFAAIASFADMLRQSPQLNKFF